MTKEQTFNIGLPKWPQCVIWGDVVTEEQALEIIRRTDTFFDGYNGNNREFNEKAYDICKCPQMKNYDNQNSENRIDGISKYFSDCDDFKKRWGYIETSYIHNDWISCCWVGGPHGWCHPDGTIGFQNNIGKWPDVEDVYNDLEILAKEFPFLHMYCTLMDGEESEAQNSLISFEIENGKVDIIETIPKERLEYKGVPFSFIGLGNENYFNLSQIQKWADKIYNKKGEKDE